MQLFRSKIIQYSWFLLLGGIVIKSLIPYASPEAEKSVFSQMLHLGSYAILAFLPVYDCLNVTQGLYLAILMAIIGSGVEFLQLYIPGRECSAMDIFMNNIGAGLGTFFGAVFRFKKKTKAGKHVESKL
jgi:VanZ family protein